MTAVATLTVNMVIAQENSDRPPRRDDAGGKSEALTADQANKVKSILSKYDASALTAEKAKAIHEDFRNAGLRGGPAMNDAVKAAGFDPEKLRDLVPPRGGNSEKGKRSEGNDDNQARGDDKQDSDGEKQSRGGDSKSGKKDGKGKGGQGKGGKSNYSIDQAVSDRAQLSTIAFSGLAFITGDFGAATFIPPGKVCDFFGFQYMRDIDAAGKGHNPIFLSRVAGNVLFILNDKQKALFEKAAKEESRQLVVLAEKRLPLIKAFCRELNAETPAGSKGLNKESVVQYVGDIFAFDAELSYNRVEVFRQLIASFTPDQKAYLAKMKFGDFNTWPDVDVEQYKLPRGTDKMINVTYMTYASEFFSWYAGNVEADVYFCPERHGTYFGGFYMKDMPAMGKKDFDISTSVTGDSGEEFLGILTDDQRKNVTAIMDLQRKAIKETIEVRRSISTELRKVLKGEKIEKDKLIALGRHYGELDGEMSYYYAAAFAKVNRTLTADQRKTLVKLRNLDGYTSAPYYIYSTAMKENPVLPDTDHFFFPPKTK